MEVSKELQNALDGKFRHAESLAFWRDVAAGHRNEETLAWVQLIAKRVLEANESERRAEAMLKAVGLTGSDKHADLRAMVKALDGIDDDVTMADMIKHVRAAGLADDMADDALRVTIRRELEK